MLLKNRQSNITAIFIALLIVFPFFQLGYVQTLDMNWGPFFKDSQYTDNTWLMLHILEFIGAVVSTKLIQITVMISIIVLTFLGIVKLLITLIENSRLLILGSILYIFNPFFYSRLLAGQWYILLGYAILPWAVAYWWKFLQNPRFKTAWPVGAWVAAIGLTSIHTIGIFALAAIVMAAFAGRKQLKAKLKWGAVIAGLFLLANAIWLVPLLTGQSPTSQNIDGFVPSEFAAFATKGTVAGSVPLSAALLTGFWADDQNRYILPSSLPIWYVGVAIIAALVIAGLIKVWRSRDRLGLALAVSGFIAWLLGMGLAWGGSAWLTQLLLHVIPFYNGYREPQKWLMLLALAYAYLAAVGAAAIYARLKNYHWQPAASIFVAVTLLAPFLFAPTLAWGAAGQLKSADYPAGWYQAKDYLNAQNLSNHDNILSLPWHLYLPLDFTGRVVANPSNYFFDQNFIVGNNFELRGVPNRNSTPLQNYVNTRLIPLESEHDQVGTSLDRYDVDYVMLLKQADWQRYAWLNDQADLPIVLQNNDLILYKVAP